MRITYKCVLVAIVGAAIVACFMSTATLKDQTLIHTVNLPGGASASIVATRDSILFGTYRADLVFTAKDEKIISRTNLLRSRDCVEDITMELLSLGWDGRELVLKAKGDHYKGANTFKLPGRSP